MARLLAMYKPPVDAAAFDSYYFGKHVPLAKTVPGLLKYEVNSGPVMAMQGDAPYYLIATLHFASVEAMRAGLASPQGQATAGDLANFASAGVEIVYFDEKAV